MPAIEDIYTYAHLRKVVAAFAAGKIKNLILLGDGGMGKTTILSEFLPDFPHVDEDDEVEDEDEKKKKPNRERGWWKGHVKENGPHAKWLNNRVSAVIMYCNLYEYQDAPIVFDDVDGMYSDKQAVSLLKSVCNTRPENPVAWHTASKELQYRGCRQQFRTSSQVCIIANEWSNLNANVGALEDRAFVVRFAPPPVEVLNHVRGWFKDRDVLNHVEANISHVHNLTQRMFYTSAELKAAGLDWRAWLNRQFGEPDHLRILRGLLRAVEAKTLTTHNAILKYQEETGYSRPSYFLHKKQVEGKDAGRKAIETKKPKKR